MEVGGLFTKSKGYKTVAIIANITFKHATWSDGNDSLANHIEKVNIWVTRHPSDSNKMRHIPYTIEFQAAKWMYLSKIHTNKGNRAGDEEQITISVK